MAHSTSLPNFVALLLRVGASKNKIFKEENPKGCWVFVKKYEFFEHTADIGIKAFGKTLKELFANAATGMFEIISAKKKKVDTKKQEAEKFEIIKQADSLENLMVEWLDELLFLFATKNIVFEKFEIKELNEKYIKALAFGLAAKNFDINTEVKAVTYHMLEVKKDRNNWKAQVIFDV